MTKVTFNHKNGRQEVMEERYARILGGLKRGTYLTRDMQATPVVQAPAVIPAPVTTSAVESETAADEAKEQRPKRKYTRKAKE